MDKDSPRIQTATSCELRLVSMIRTNALRDLLFSGLRSRAQGQRGDGVIEHLGGWEAMQSVEWKPAADVIGLPLVVIQGSCARPLELRL